MPTKKILLVLSDEQAEQLEALSKGRKRQEVIRNLVDEAFYKRFPEYTKKAGKTPNPLLELSFEKLCVDVAGGEWDGQVCVVKSKNNPNFSQTYKSLKLLQDDYIN